MTTFCFVVILSEAKDLSWLNDIGSAVAAKGNRALPAHGMAMP